MTQQITRYRTRRGTHRSDGRAKSPATERPTAAAVATRSAASHSPVAEAPVRSNTLRLIPLGGVEEIGRNCTVYEYNDDIILF